MASTVGSGRTAPKPKTFYLDASAMVKRYLAETGSAWVETLCADETSNAIAIAHIGLVEVAAAFAAKRRANDIAVDEYNTALADLIHDSQVRYRLIVVNPGLIDSAIQLTRRRRLRGYDAVHLACALAVNKPLAGNKLPPLTFVAADDDLLAAAAAEGLAIENPNKRP